MGSSKGFGSLVSFLLVGSHIYDPIHTIPLCPTEVVRAARTLRDRLKDKARKAAQQQRRKAADAEATATEALLKQVEIADARNRLEQARVLAYAHPVSLRIPSHCASHPIPSHPHLEQTQAEVRAASKAAHIEAAGKVFYLMGIELRCNSHLYMQRIPELEGGDSSPPHSRRSV